MAIALNLLLLQHAATRKEGVAMKQTFTVSIWDAAGQDVARPGDIFAKIFACRGSHPNI